MCIPNLVQTCWDKNKSICSSSSSQLTGQICQIVFVMLTVLAVHICHCAEVWFLTDSMQLSVFMCTDWTEHATVLQHSLAEPPPPYHQGDEVSAKMPLRGLLCSRQMTVCVLLAYLIKTIDETLPLATHLNQFSRPDTGHTQTSKHSKQFNVSLWKSPANKDILPSWISEESHDIFQSYY